ncbi:MAG: TetR/AcrR family transcriptional regulator [Kocuria rhizophila]|uniref:TetR/AcrR family transcriptional regulator n=1 Tax=Kocuria carniphila TaxID=262208 RepID=UPI000DB796CF|nr:TetR/AcrR family transcriptional regulator [Kocuria carniphila]MCT1804086.1 TetR/AcrR family transcriptional regulator [Kocuria carniphila]PZP37379.1 MAG: TetR/AcrR family transcriptional regulator [Kocuria rhizophila]
MTDRTAKSVQTRQRFVDVALQLIKERGYEQTSMAQIASAAGSSRANLYLYFKSKPQIIMARMQEIEPLIASLYDRLDQMSSHSCEAMKAWLDEARDMWIRYSTEFEAINRAMATDPEVLDEWLGLGRRISSRQSTLYKDCRDQEERLDREVHLTTLMMSLERNFYFLYIRGHREREDRVLASLARQWAQLFGE